MKGESRKVRGRSNVPHDDNISEDPEKIKERRYDEDEEEFRVLSLEEQRCINAKLYLMREGSDDGQNLYNHLSTLLTRVLVEESGKALDRLEADSKTYKRERFAYKEPFIKDDPGKTPTEVLAHAQWRMVKTACGDPKFIPNESFDLPDEDEEDIYRLIPDLMKQALFFEQAGVGLPREEFIRISVSMRELVENWPIETLRFWGKIMGTRKNYYVVEAEFKDGEYDSDFSDEEEEKSSNDKIEDSMIFDDESTTVTEDIKPYYKPPPRIPCESLGTGLNKHIYFVCNEPGLLWTRLPHINPAQIVIARKIRHFFTGDLNEHIVSHPPFPGLEKNYLRAQIARISAATTVSPIGYFRFDDNEEEEDAEESGTNGRNNCIIDQEFEGMPLRDLCDPTGQTWCHHMQSILPQGRNTWHNPMEGRSGEGGEEDSDEEERNEPDEPEPEVGPPLLTPASEDKPIIDSPAWIARISSRLVPEFAVAVLQSNTWPGSWTFGAERGRYFTSIYIGWGQKNLGDAFEPELPPDIMDEFPSGPEITEADDPSPEEESAFKAALADKEFDAEFGEDQGEEETSDVDD
ncbi:radial spoke head protein 6 homolog A-like [Saccostrea echinata]|uniref:radial spoke head protein 6 homolog A-like n=1 Tax=Saccostrea echinata TaxID=191078 RepID=UPI002A832424|nr:radial spoke head protein 6 homolog A-like [Saccostrea echinata]